MTTRTLTTAQLALLRAIAAGEVDNLGGAMFYGSIGGGRRRRLVAQVRALDTLGLINPYGIDMKHGEPSTARFPDHHLVTLTPAGQHALATGITDKAQQ